mgnify:CR=1 FL=1
MKMVNKLKKDRIRRKKELEAQIRQKTAAIYDAKLKTSLFTKIQETEQDIEV